MRSPFVDWDLIPSLTWSPTLNLVATQITKTLFSLGLEADWVAAESGISTPLTFNHPTTVASLAIAIVVDLLPTNWYWIAIFQTPGFIQTSTFVSVSLIFQSGVSDNSQGTNWFSLGLVGAEAIVIGLQKFWNLISIYIYI